METITYTYGSWDKPPTVIPLWEIPQLSITQNYGEQSLIVVNGVEAVLENIRDYFAFERLDFCGCGNPEEVDRFWIDQIVSIDSDQITTDYIGYSGGLELFMDLAVKKGMLNENYKLTPTGKLAVLVLATHYGLGQEENVPTVVPDYIITRADEYDEPQDRIDYFLLRAMVVPGIRRRMEIPGGAWGEGSDLQYNSDPMKVSDGVYYWLYHAIEGMGWAEHGSSAPGWLTTAGNKKLVELVLRFGIEELSIIDMVSGGFVFRKSRVEELLDLVPLLRDHSPDINWDVIFRTCTQDLLFNPNYETSGCTMTYDVSSTFPAGKKAEV